MTNLIIRWEQLSSEFRKRASECDNETARKMMIARAEVLEGCIGELITAYLGGE